MCFCFYFVGVGKSSFVKAATRYAYHQRHRNLRDGVLHVDLSGKFDAKDAFFKIAQV